MPLAKLLYYTSEQLFGKWHTGEKLAVTQMYQDTENKAKRGEKNIIPNKKDKLTVIYIKTD